MLVENTPLKEPLFRTLEQKLGRQTFETWFRPLSVSTSSRDQVLRISAPNAVVKDWILDHYSTAIRDSLAELNLAQYRLEWSICAAAVPVRTQPPEATTNHEALVSGAHAERLTAESDALRLTDGPRALLTDN